MEEIVEYILQKINVDERGNLLAYKILCNLAVDLTLKGDSKEQIIEYLKTLMIDLDQRKLCK